MNSEPVEVAATGKPEPIYGWGALPPDAVPPILLYGDKRLREPCDKVDDDAFNDDEHSTLRQGLQLLAAVLDRHQGAAVAAPQVGILQRVIVIAADVAGDLTDGYPFGLINPEITDHSDELVIDQEGCLSFPNIYVRVQRPTWVTAHAQTPTGDHFEVKAHGVFARALCHEIEHLDGRLLIDHTAGLKHQMITTKMTKFRQRLERPPKGSPRPGRRKR